MKKINLFAVLFVVTLSLQAQIKSPDALTIGNSKSLTGVLMPLSENQTFMYVVPEKLAYWKAGGQLGWNLNVSVLDTKAKKINKGEPDYVFRLVTSGIENLTYGNPVPYAGGKGVPFIYNFPCTLEMADKNGTIIQTFELSPPDRLYGCIVGPNFLSEEKTPLISNAVNRTNTNINTNSESFNVSDAIIMEWVTVTKKNEIFTRIEYTFFQQLVRLGSSIIRSGYGYPAIFSKPAILTLDKKDVANFPELDQAVTKLAKEVEQAFVGIIDQPLQEALLASAQYFESQYTSSSSKSMRQLCAINAGIGYALAGDMDKAAEHKKQAEVVLGMFSKAIIALGSIYDEMEFIHNLRSGSPLPMEFTNSEKERSNYAIAQMEKQETNMGQIKEQIQELQSRNISRQVGFVVNKKGETIMSNEISIQFVPNADKQGLQTDFGQSVNITDNKPSSYRVNNVQYVMIGEERFDPVTIRELDNSFLSVSGGALKIGSPALDMKSLIGKTFFMKSLYTKGECTAYQLLVTQKVTYYIVKKTGEKAVALADILENGKPTKKYIGNCSALQERLDTKSISNDENGAIEFVDLLSECL